MAQIKDLVLEHEEWVGERCWATGWAAKDLRYLYICIVSCGYIGEFMYGVVFVGL